MTINGLIILTYTLVKSTRLSVLMREASNLVVEGLSLVGSNKNNNDLLYFMYVSDQISIRGGSTEW